MRNIVTKAIVLTRVDFQEADRIITVITPDQGKLTLMAKGVRKSKSKLAGGIELFSVSDITYIPGRGEVGTLVSTRLLRHFGNIVSDINRTMFAYDVLKKFNKVTEDAAEPAYFTLLERTLEGLDSQGLGTDIIDFWFSMQLLNISGHAPNLQTDSLGDALTNNGKYIFDYDTVSFAPDPHGPFGANHIKLMSLGMRANQPAILDKVQNANELFASLLMLAKTILSRSVRI